MPSFNKLDHKDFLMILNIMHEEKIISNQVFLRKGEKFTKFGILMKGSLLVCQKMVKKR